MPRLHVNIDHVATLRQARRSQEPDPVTAAAICELAGADGITVHLREDRRHIQDRDVHILRKTVKTLLNLEMALTPEILEIALDVSPDQVCIVPEKRQELTTEGGLDVAGHSASLDDAIPRFKGAGIEVSLFVDPMPEPIELAAQLGADFVEIHTGSYANAPTGRARGAELDRLKTSAHYAESLGLRVNAGHGLDYRNILPVVQIPQVEELNIGYSILCRSIYVGLDQAVREMQDRILAAAPPEAEESPAVAQKKKGNRA
jgi:pyridoxine 5-phosphate synthase